MVADVSSPGTKTSRPDNSGRTIQVIPGTGTITGEYKSGGTIKLKYKMTANHKGYFLVKLCVTDNQYLFMVTGTKRNQ